MNLEHLHRAFSRLGARVKFGRGGLDVLRDVGGEFFRLDLEQARGDGYDALDVQPRRRHLVLVSRGAETVERFLCGHDERHWFVAGVEHRGPATVEAALDALQPGRIREALRASGERHRRRHRRRTAAFVRQGEWFFIPRPDFVPPDDAVLRDEPLVRGRGKAHVAERLCRSGGETVYVSDLHPRGLTADERRDFEARQPHRRLNWRVMARNAAAYVKDRVRHPDHATLVLDCWHEVALSAELSSRNLVFLD
jgi:hypothetical protein